MRYSRRNEGSAREIRINAGRVVHTASILWASRIVRDLNLLISRASMAYATVVVINIRIIIAWSWKMMSCVMMGDAASCKEICPQVAI